MISLRGINYESCLTFILFASYLRKGREYLLWYYVKLRSPGGWVEKIVTTSSQISDGSHKTSSLRDKVPVDTYMGFCVRDGGRDEDEKQWLHDLATSSYEGIGWLADGLWCVTTMGAESFKVRFRVNPKWRFGQDAKNGTVSPNKAPY